MNRVRFLGFMGAVIAITQTGVMMSASPARAEECYEKAPLRPIHRTFVRRDIVEPGLYEVTRTPSQYGYYKRRVIEPHEGVWHESPAVYRSVTKRIRVSGGWTWANKCVEGREIKCRVRAPARYETVEKQVLVRPARRWATHAPKVGYVHERVLLRPYRNIAYYHRPHVRTYRERLKIYPEGYHWTRVRPNC